MQICRPWYLINKSSICRDSLKLDRSRSIELTGFQIIASNVFILKGYLFMGLYNPYWTRKTQGLCKPIRNRRALKLLFKGGGKKNFETLASSYRRKSSCCVSSMPLGSVTKQSPLHQHWRSYWCFYVKLLQINYNNQRVAVELVTYWDSCKGVSRVLGSAHQIG